MGTIFGVYIPQIITPFDSIEPQITLRFPTQKINFLLQWKGSTSTMLLTAINDVLDGIQDFTIGSSVLQLSNQIIYENDKSISYSLSLGGSVLGGTFDHVFPRGLVFSSLSLGNPRKGQVTSLTLVIIAEIPLYKADKIIIELPNFIGLDRDVLSVTGNGSSYVLAQYSDRHSGIVIDIKKATQRLDLVVGARNGISFPIGNTGGSNPISGAPLISLRTRNYQFFTASPFKVYLPIAFLYASNITFQV
jgi:hypothetical protein